MNTNYIIGVIVIIVIIVGGFFLFQQEAAAPENGGANVEVANEEERARGGQEDGRGAGNDAASPASPQSETTGEGAVQESGGGASQEQPAPDEDAQSEPEEPSGPVTVTYTNDGYSPSTVTIGAGESVMFINESSRTMWPASVIHPTHTIYPGSSIGKCNTDEESFIFDACGAHSSGTSWSFTFTEVGEWRYHDHLRPSTQGTIIVE